MSFRITMDYYILGLPTLVPEEPYIVNIKHRPMKNKEDIVKETLSNPEEIYRSKIDHNIYLYYRQFDRIYCIVVKHIGEVGFLITAYPTDKIKEGERIWKK